jgi:glycerol-3-phosphate dehydrogenase (NAD(P)+)
MPPGAVVACRDADVAQTLQRLFNSGLYRVYTTDDVVGAEVAGALKNVIAIAAGMADGLGVGDNTRALIIARGLAELTRLGVAMGGAAWTFAGLGGGDQGR